MGLGAYPGSDRQFLGMLGMHGARYTNMALEEADLLLAFGVRFDDRVTGRTEAFAAQADIVHIDIDPTSIRKNIPVTLPLVGDCRIALEEIVKLLDGEDLGNLQEKRREWLERIDYWKSTKPLAYTQKDRIKPQFVVDNSHANPVNSVVGVGVTQVKGLIRFQQQRLNSAPVPVVDGGGPYVVSRIGERPPGPEQLGASGPEQGAAQGQEKQGRIQFC